MKQSEAICYTILVILLAISVVINVGYKTQQNDYKELDINNTDSIVDLSNEVRVLEHNVTMLQSEIVFNNINCNLDSIQDNLEDIIYILDNEQLNITVE